MVSDDGSASSWPLGLRCSCALALGLTVGTSAGVSCESSTSEATGAQPPVLEGTYQATSDGPFSQIAFYDSTRYSVLLSNCDGGVLPDSATSEFAPEIDPDDPCIQSGSYALSETQDALLLTEDTS